GEPARAAAGGGVFGHLPVRRVGGAAGVSGVREPAAGAAERGGGGEQGEAAARDRERELSCDAGGARRSLDRRAADPERDRRGGVPAAAGQRADRAHEVHGASARRRADGGGYGGGSEAGGA